MSDTIVAAIVGGLVGGAVAFSFGWFTGYSWGRKYMERYIRLYNIPCGRKITTNADRIRRMTDKELAEFMRSVCDTWYIDTNQNWLSWLKSPAEKDGEA